MTNKESNDWACNVWHTNKGDKEIIDQAPTCYIRFDLFDEIITKNERIIEGYGLADNHFLTECIAELKKVLKKQENE